MLHKIKFYTKFLSASAVLALFILACGDTNSTAGKYKIVLNGTDKMRYSGFYKIISPSGVIKSNTVTGVLPAEYYIEDCKSLVCSFSMEADRGELRMTVQDENGNELKNETTNMPYGSVQLTTDF